MYSLHVYYQSFFHLTIWQKGDITTRPHICGVNVCVYDPESRDTTSQHGGMFMLGS